MSSPPRFRQSHAKVLLQECPAMLRQQLVNDEQRRTSKAMDRGSLVDLLVFNQRDRFEIVEAFYKSGPRKGEPAIDWQCKEAKDAAERIRRDGKLPVLQPEVDDLEATADAIRARILSIAHDSPVPPEICYQQTLDWTSAFGTECSGTPDVVIYYERDACVEATVIDVKHTAVLQQRKFERQIHAMCWHVQAAAYADAVAHWGTSKFGKNTYVRRYVILATLSILNGLPPCARDLEPSYIALGDKQWQKAQETWRQCVTSGDWPGYPEEPAQMPQFARLELERAGGGGTFNEFEEEP